MYIYIYIYIYICHITKRAYLCKHISTQLRIVQQTGTNTPSPPTKIIPT